MYCLHGDVVITKIEHLPPGANRVSRGKQAVLRRGEATGHAHVATGTAADTMVNMFTLPNGLQFLVCDGNVEVTHQEHKVGVLPKGTYQIGAVPEYDHFLEEARAVLD